MSVFDGLDLPDAAAFEADRVRREDRARLRAEHWLSWLTIDELELLLEHLRESIADDPPGVVAPDVVARLELLQCRGERRRAADLRPWRLSECPLHGMHRGCCLHQVWLVEYERARDLCVEGVAGCRCLELVLDDVSIEPAGLRAAAAGRCLGRRVGRVADERGDPVERESPVDREGVDPEVEVVVDDVKVDERPPVLRPRSAGVGGVLLIPGVDRDPVDLIASLSRSAVIGYRE